jgi:hypothetical protein
MTSGAASMGLPPLAATLRMARVAVNIVVIWLTFTATSVAQHAEMGLEPWYQRLTPEICCREYWVVNARYASPCDSLESGFDQLTYWKSEDAGGWREYSRDEFVEAMDPSLPTTFFVHGSFLNHKWAVRCGWRCYREIGSGVPAFRLVLWSWPAERIPHMDAIENFYVKMEWSERQGYYLAALIDQLDPDLPLSLTGHSIGCRTACAALDGLACGEVAGEPLPPASYTGRRPIQACFLVPAFDPRYLWPKGKYSYALSQLDRLLVVYNPEDRMMGLHSRHISPWVLGWHGMPEPERLGKDQHKLKEVSSEEWVGNDHRFSVYAHTKEGRSWMQRYFFYQDAKTELQVADDTP